MGNVNNLISSGLTNYNSPDYGTLATSTTKLEYDYYCSSRACSQTNKKIGEWKLRSSEHVRSCPDCGNLLYSKRCKNG
jgi:hypothetical protein